MATASDLNNLRRIRELLVGYRREQASYVLEWEGHEDVPPANFRAIYEVQEAIDTVDRAIEDERRLANEKSYNLDSLA